MLPPYVDPCPDAFAPPIPSTCVYKQGLMKHFNLKLLIYMAYLVSQKNATIHINVINEFDYLRLVELKGIYTHLTTLFVELVRVK